MILRRFLIMTVFALATGAAAAAPKKAPPASRTDEAMLGAHAAFMAGDAVRLGKHAAALQGHVLEPWVEFWRMNLRLEDTPVRELQAFMQQNAGSYLADRLRAEWLRALGRRADWQSFEAEFPLLIQDEIEVRCYAWLSRLARADASAYEEAREILLEPKELPDGCGTLAEKMIGDGKVSNDELWQRARLLFENGRLSAARRWLANLPQGETHDERLLNQAATAPQKLLASPPRNLERRATREMVLFAVVRLARTDPRAAADALRGALGTRLPQPDQQYLWGQLGHEAARRHDVEATDWFKLAGPAELGDEKLAWKARAALRTANWQMVRDAIDPMSAKAREDPAWSYWYGRALAAQDNADGARAYYLRISGLPNFYGLLAAEELGYMVAVPEPFHVPAEQEVAEAKRNPGIARALEMYRLDLRNEATREWLFTVRRMMDDARLLATAEVARRAEVFDRAMNTADRTKQRHNFKLRYLAPFQEVFREQARVYDLEEAWVLGVVRQESRFIANAKSPAGAQGLMQLMPATARWVAKRAGLRNYNGAKVYEVETNVTLGTRYLKLVLDDLGHPVLASAAYNAGPGRARRWRDTRPLEGAVYAETIPFNETRDYVKRVMANTVFYAQLFGGAVRPLKERLGVISAKSSADRFNEELP
jgi:soluble lytic murein transglycosylase